MRWPSLFLVAALLAPVPAAAQRDVDREIAQQKQRLEELRRQAEEARRKAAQFAREERGVLERLKKADEAIEATRRYIKSLEEREAMLEADIRRTERRLAAARSELAVRREALRKRLRHTYVRGRAGTLEVLLSARSFPDLLERSVFLERVLSRDREMIGDVRDRAEAVQRDLDRLRQRRNEIERLQAAKAAEKRKYEALRARREEDLSQVRGRRAEHERAARELEQAAEQMKQVLAELERRRREMLRRDDVVLAELDRENFGANRGRLPWPVAGELIEEFGRRVHPKYGTVTLNNGIDIAAPPGTAVRSVGDGVVDLVQWLNGYGMSVIVNHGRGYYTIYAHLSATHVQQGDRVAPGQVIGAVGDTGSLKGPCLHFEIREGSTARNPLEWLR